MSFSRKVIRNYAKELFKNYWGYQFSDFWKDKNIIKKIKKRINKKEVK